MIASSAGPPPPPDDNRIPLITSHSLPAKKAKKGEEGQAKPLGKKPDPPALKSKDLPKPITPVIKEPDNSAEIEDMIEEMTRKAEADEAANGQQPPP
ncbi:hypothetical protein AgCh_035412 [Apium graveolens]